MCCSLLGDVVARVVQRRKICRRARYDFVKQLRALCRILRAHATAFQGKKLTAGRWLVSLRDASCLHPDVVDKRLVRDAREKRDAALPAACIIPAVVRSTASARGRDSIAP